eukprot:COSAG04_NODE_19638_length_411_cov_0.996795_1_plen_112_part_10
MAGYDEANRLDHGALAAISPRFAATVRKLLAAQAPLSGRDAAGMTPLHAAARARWPRGLELLAKAAAEREPAAVEARTEGGDPRRANMTALLVVASGLRHALMLLATTALKA